MGKSYIIDSEAWPEAAKYGFDLTVEDNANIATFHEYQKTMTKEQIARVREVTKEQLPDIFKSFYNNVMKVLNDAMGPRHQDHYIDIVEEVLGHELCIALMWFGAGIDPTLIKEDH